MHNATILQVALAVLICSAVGCTNQYRIQEFPIESTDRAMLTQPGPIDVALPEDGQYGGRDLRGSGRMVQAAVIAALKQVGADARAAPVPTGAASQLQTAALLVTPTVLEWEDRATEWSGKPDRLQVDLRTTNAKGVLVDSAIVSGSSKWATLGGDHPQDMLLHALAPWAKRFLRPSGR